MRKTTSVSTLIKYVNQNLTRKDEYATVGYKMGLCDVLESVLHSTDSYRGFGFIDSDDSETGSLGYYSRHYYISNKLTK
jgi:hypothetical protein